MPEHSTTNTAGGDGWINTYHPRPWVTEPLPADLTAEAAYTALCEANGGTEPRTVRELRAVALALGLKVMGAADDGPALAPFCALVGPGVLFVDPRLPLSVRRRGMAHEIVELLAWKRTVRGRRSVFPPKGAGHALAVAVEERIFGRYRRRAYAVG